MSKINNSETINSDMQDFNPAQICQANLSVLVEPTSYCNLDCTYCYKGKKPNKTMSFYVLENMLQKIISYNESRNMPTSFVWHGGEPTMELSFMKRHSSI